VFFSEEHAVNIIATIKNRKRIGRIIAEYSKAQIS
jgi:hypothetical protein